MLDGIRFAANNLKESRQMANQYGVKIPFINLSGDNDVFDPRFPGRYTSRFKSRSFSIEEPAGKKAMAALQTRLTSIHKKQLRLASLLSQARRQQTLLS